MIKIAVRDRGEFRYHKFPTKQIELAASWVNDTFPGADIAVTGGKSVLLKSLLTADATAAVGEFDASCEGVQYLLKQAGVTIDSFILTNVGTGTSIHHVGREDHSRIGGTGVGGGTLMGLSYLLTRIDRYDEIVRLSKLGRRDLIDLTVAHIYEGAVPPIPGDLTASNFGHPKLSAAEAEPEDLLASVIGMVGETVSTVSVFAAGQARTSQIVYIGSSFYENDLLKQVVDGYTRFRGAEPIFLEFGEFSGAIGASLIGSEVSKIC